MMDTSKHLLWLLGALFLLSTQTHSSQTSQSPQELDFSCLIQDPLPEHCIMSLNFNKITELHPETPHYACPLLLKFCSQQANLNPEAFRKAEYVCKLSAVDNAESGYLLLGLYAIGGRYVDMAEVEYRLFFNQPFQHERKLKQVFQKYGKYLTEGVEAVGNRQMSTAVRLFYSGKTQESLKIVQRLVGVTGQSRQKLELAHLFRLRILEKNGEFPRALDQVNNLIKTQGSSAHWYLHHIKGNLLMHHLKFRQAITSFEHSIRAKDQSEQIFSFSLYNIGLCYQKLGQFTRSADYLKKLLVVSPDSAQGLNSLGFTYYSLIELATNDKDSQQNTELAQKYFKRAIEADKSYYVTYHNYAMLKLDQGQYKQASELFYLALQINDKNMKASHYGLFKSLYHIDKKKALQFEEKQLKQRYGYPLYEVGLLYHQLGQDKKALEYLEEASKQRSNLGEVYQWKGIIEFQLNLISAAAQSFKKSLQNGNTKASIWFNLGYVQELQSNYQKAEIAYKKALQKDPKGAAVERLKQIKQKIAKNTKKSDASQQQTNQL